MTADDPRDKSRATWDAMAPGWERNRAFMWETTRHVAEWLIDAADPRPGDTLLDLAAGPGDVGFAASARVRPRGKVIVTDFAAQMVEVATRRAKELAVDGVETRVLDAERMDIEDANIDGIICRWGFMLMIDPAAALRECKRVLRDGRALAFSVWGRPEQNLWVTVPGMTAVQLGHQPGGDPFGPGGMFSLSNHDTIRQMVRAAGFEDVVIEDMRVDWRYASFGEAWSFMTEVAGALASLVQELPEDRVAEYRSALEENMSPFQEGAGLSLPGVTVNVRAR